MHVGVVLMVPNLIVQRGSNFDVVRGVESGAGLTAPTSLQAS